MAKATYSNDNLSSLDKVAPHALKHISQKDCLEPSTLPSESWLLTTV